MFGKLADNDDSLSNPVGKRIGRALRAGATWQIIIAIAGILISLLYLLGFGIFYRNPFAILVGVLELYASYRLLKANIVAGKAAKNGDLYDVTDALASYGLYFKLYCICFLIALLASIGAPHFSNS